MRTRLSFVPYVRAVAGLIVVGLGAWLVTNYVRSGCEPAYKSRPDRPTGNFVEDKKTVALMLDEQISIWEEAAKIQGGIDDSTLAKQAVKGLRKLVNRRNDLRTR